MVPFKSQRLDSKAMDRSGGIVFDNQAVQDEFRKLLLHQCRLCRHLPPFANLGQLKEHLRKEHEQFFCDLCVDNLKVRRRPPRPVDAISDGFLFFSVFFFDFFRRQIFTWERRHYTRQELGLHRRKGDPDDTSHRGHPLCNFCDQRYVDNDELFRHLRRDHYFCHFCDADGLNQYYW